MAAGESGGQDERAIHCSHSSVWLAADRTEIEDGLTHPRGTVSGTERQA